MRLALAQAKQALAQAEVPVGAILVYQNQVIAQNFNHCVAQDNPFAHAEMLVLSAAVQQLGSSALRESTLYVTLEPCPMCMGAILHSHIQTLVYGCNNLKWGACQTLVAFDEVFPASNLEILAGIGELDAQALLKTSFQQLRSSKNQSFEA